MNHGLHAGGVSWKKPPFGRWIFVLAVVGIATAAWCRAESNDTPASTNPFLESGADDPGWPFLRGPNYDGHSPETHLADAWPARGPPVLWTRPLGQGYSGFVAWDGRVATQYQTLAGQFVVCLDADTGETIWRHRYQWPYEPAGVYPGPRATPTYAQGCVYFASPTGLVGCVDARNGKRLWSVDVQRQFGGRGTDFGYACSPTVVAGKVLLPVGGPGAGMVALNARDGSLVWKAGDDEASYTPAYPITFRGRRLVIGYLQNALVCHDLESGELVWRRVLSSGYDEHSAWPIYSEPYLWISGPFQSGSELLELTDDPSHPINSVRKSRVMSNDVASSVLVDGAVYGFDLREAQAKTHRPSRGLFWSITFVAGALGTTVLSRLLDEFVFTWPVSVFVAFQAVVWEIAPRASTRHRAARWRSRAVVLGFGATCLAYFLLCRRLSLVFEWVFLCGFVGALPFSLAGKSWFQKRRWSWLWEVSTTGAAFAGFYWLSAAVLWLKQ